VAEKLTGGMHASDQPICMLTNAVCSLYVVFVGGKSYKCKTNLQFVNIVNGDRSKTAKIKKSNIYHNRLNVIYCG